MNKAIVLPSPFLKLPPVSHPIVFYFIFPRESEKIGLVVTRQQRDTQYKLRTNNLKITTWRPYVLSFAAAVTKLTCVTFN